MGNVGFIGLGSMGRGMCRNLIRKGNTVSVFDISSNAMKQFESEAQLCSSCVEVLENSSYIFLSLPNSEAVESIVDKLLQHDIKGKIIVDTSTSFPISTRELYKRIKSAGGGLVDSPLMSGPREAEAGELVAVAAGDEEDVDAVHNLLMSYCKHYDYVGQTGNGHLIKLVQNFSGLTQALLYAQIYPIMEKYGIAPQETYKLFNNDIFSNWIFQFYSDKYIRKDYRMDFRLSLGLKDLTYMKRLCENLNIPGFLLDGALDLLRVALKDSKGEEVDFSYSCATMYDFVD